MNKKNIKRGLLPYLFLFLILIGVMFFLNSMNSKVNVITYDEFMKDVAEGKVTEVTITPRSRASVYEIKGKLKGYEENESFFFRAPLAEEVMTQVLTASENYAFVINTSTDPESSTFLLFVINVLPMVLLIGFAFFFITRQMGTANKSMDFGKSRARLSEDSKKVTFKDVAGLTEEKEEVQELIDFLKNPKKFQKLVQEFQREYY